MLLVIDSMRADKCFGPTKSSQTPNIDNLIKNGVYFDQAIASVGSTISSLASIFTGMFPINTGMSSNKFEKLDSNVKSYVSVLKEIGYSTYAASPPLTSALGITDNFENKDRHYDNYLSLFEGLGNEIHDFISNKEMQEPWFFYFHINDLHPPIKIPKEFDTNKYGNSNHEKMISAIDFWIGKILSNIDLENTLIVITSDHGDYLPIHSESNLNLESGSSNYLLWKLGNRIPKKLHPLKSLVASNIHNMREKSKQNKIKNLKLSEYEKRNMTKSRMGEGHHLYDDVVKVPLILSGFKINHNVITQQVRHVDIFPTILDLIDEKNKNNTDGCSLKSLMNNENIEELYAYIESPPTIIKNTEKIVGVRTKKFKYIRNLNDKTKNIELYDLENDPLEEKNIVESNIDDTKKLETILEKFITKTSKKVSDISTEERLKVEEELKKLGYM